MHIDTYGMIPFSPQFLRLLLDSSLRFFLLEFMIYPIRLLPALALCTLPLNTSAQTVESVSHTPTLNSMNGGATGANASFALLDGDVDGASGSFVEYIDGPTVATFSFSFDGPYAISGFSLWNDRGKADSGIGNFNLVMRDAAAGEILTISLAGSLPHKGNSPTPETFTFATVNGVHSVDLVVFDEVGGISGSNIQFREIDFDAVAVPEPGSLAAGTALVALGAVVRRRRVR